MKRTRSTVLMALLAGALLLPLTGCGDNDSDIDIDIPEPTATSGGGGTPVRTATPGAVPTPTAIATTAEPTATPDGGDTPTPEPTGAPCSDPSVVVEVSIDVAYGAARIDLVVNGAKAASNTHMPSSMKTRSAAARVVATITCPSLRNAGPSRRIDSNVSKRSPIWL